MLINVKQQRSLKLTNSRRRAAMYRPQLESLEQRQLLTNGPLDTLDDGQRADGPSETIREKANDSMADNGSFEVSKNQFGNEASPNARTVMIQSLRKNPTSVSATAAKSGSAAPATPAPRAEPKDPTSHVDDEARITIRATVRDGNRNKVGIDHEIADKHISRDSGAFIFGRGGRPPSSADELLLKLATKSQELDIRDKVSDRAEKLLEHGIKRVIKKIPDEFREGKPIVADGQILNPADLLDVDALTELAVNHPRIRPLLDAVVDLFDSARNLATRAFVGFISDADVTAETVSDETFVDESSERKRHDGGGKLDSPETEVDPDFDIRPKLGLGSDGLELQTLKAKFKITVRIPGFGTLESNVRGNLDDPFGRANLELETNVTFDLTIIPLDFNGHAAAQIDKLNHGAELGRFFSSLSLGLDLPRGGRATAGVDFERHGSDDLVRGRLGIQWGPSTVDFFYDSEGEYAVNFNLLELELGRDRTLDERERTESLMPPGFDVRQD